MALSEQRTANEAAALASNIPLCSARYYKFLDSDGVSRGIEHDGVRTYDVNGFAAHTNHFISTEGAVLEGRLGLVRESEGRRQLMEERLSTKLTDVKDVFGVLSFRDPERFSIMKLGVDAEDRTCAAFVISPLDRTMWYTAGPPVETEIENVSIM